MGASPKKRSAVQKARELGFELRVQGWSLAKIAEDPRINRKLNTINNWSIQHFWTERANEVRRRQGVGPLKRECKRDKTTGRLVKEGVA